MRRLTGALLAWLLLCAAAPVPVADPPAPLLGRPFVVRVPLPAGARPAGLPALGTLQPLAPPRVEEGVLQLELLPLRPGPRRLPPLPLDLPDGTRRESAPLDLEIATGLPPGAGSAPPKDLARPSTGAGPGAAAALVLLLLLAAADQVRRTRTVPAPAPLPGPPRAAEVLAGLQSELAARPELSPAQRSSLAGRIAALRFGPTPPAAEAIFALQRELYHREHPP